MNLLAPDLRAEITILVAEDWTSRLYGPKGLDQQERLRVLDAALRALIGLGESWGVRLRIEGEGAEGER